VSEVAQRLGVDLSVASRQIDAEAERLLRDTVERMPRDIPVATRLRHGTAGQRSSPSRAAGRNLRAVPGPMLRYRVTATNVLGPRTVFSAPTAFVR
jgi:hypothetical protein